MGLWNNKVQLIAYINRLGSNTIVEFNQIITEYFNEIFGGVHLLPFFYSVSGNDAGFDPIDHRVVDSELGTWKDIQALGKRTPVMADLIVNHVSSQAPQFKDFIEKGKKSTYADMFLTKGKVFNDDATEEDMRKIYRPRPGMPFTEYQLKSGKKVLMWTTFLDSQIDIDVNSKSGGDYLEQILANFHQAGIKMIRLDAAGYSIKKAGTSCFLTNETYDYIKQLTQKAHKMKMRVLAEVHAHYKKQIEIAQVTDYVYDFALPVLIFDVFFNKKTNNFFNWLKIRPQNAVTVLDTHDGIGIIDLAGNEDLPGLLSDEELDKIVEQIHHNSKNQSLEATGTSASNLDIYQINTTYYDALGRNDNLYLLARALQFFVPGVPQVYYMGLLFAKNDMKLLKETNIGRNINRTCFGKPQIIEALNQKNVQQLIKLINFRNKHRAFNGEFRFQQLNESQFTLQWHNGLHFAKLEVNLSDLSFIIYYSKEKREAQLTL